MKHSRHSGQQPFDKDVADHRGYRYTTQAPHSADVANQRLSNVTVEWLRSQAKIRTVVDLGCGDGTYTAEISHGLPRLKMVGGDPAAQAIKLARRAYPDLTFVVCDLLKPSSLPKVKADACILRGVIHHVPDARRGVMNACQYCSNILIIEPNGWNPILKIIEKISPYHRAHGERSFTSWELKNWIEESECRVSQTSYVGLVPFFCPDWLVTFLKKIEPVIEKSWLAPLFCAQVVIEVERRLV
jgi:SAM-dependent methyltransferase